MNRRSVLIGAAAASLAGRLHAEPIFRLALTPVFLDNDAVVIDRLHTALAEGMQRPIELVQRRTYQDITGALLEGSVDAAWVCGFPFLQHERELSLLGVPVWNGKPMYRSYLIVATDDPAQSLQDLRGDIHAFSDPDSNSGYLVTASDLARMGETPDQFFSRTFFTYGHRNVVRAVAAGLARSGSVDGYVWDVLSQVEPDLTKGTRVIGRSELLGFPPFAGRQDRISDPDVMLFRETILNFHQTEAGRAALGTLYLDRIDPGSVAMFDGIAARMAAIHWSP
jgi:phosphonate transport system substrate-binding protein